jgi:hypothetical protein
MRELGGLSETEELTEYDEKQHLLPAWERRWERTLHIVWVSCCITPPGYDIWRTWCETIIPLCVRILLSKAAKSIQRNFKKASNFHFRRYSKPSLHSRC